MFNISFSGNYILSLIIYPVGGLEFFMDIDNKYSELLDISDDLLYLSQIVANIKSNNDQNIIFVIVQLKIILSKLEQQ